MAQPRRLPYMRAATAAMATIGRPAAGRSPPSSSSSEGVGGAGSGSSKRCELFTVRETSEHFPEVSHPSTATTCSPSLHSSKLIFGVDHVFPVELTEPVREPSMDIENATDSPSGSLYCPCIDHCDPSHSVFVIANTGGADSLLKPMSYTCSREYTSSVPTTQTQTSTGPGSELDEESSTVTSPVNVIVEVGDDCPSCTNPISISKSGQSEVGLIVTG